MSADRQDQDDAADFDMSWRKASNTYTYDELEALSSVQLSIMRFFYKVDASIKAMASAIWRKRRLMAELIGGDGGHHTISLEFDYAAPKSLSCRQLLSVQFHPDLEDDSSETSKTHNLMAEVEWLKRAGASRKPRVPDLSTQGQSNSRSEVPLSGRQQHRAQPPPAPTKEIRVKTEAPDPSAQLTFSSPSKQRLPALDTEPQNRAEPRSKSTGLAPPEVPNAPSTQLSLPPQPSIVPTTMPTTASAAAPVPTVAGPMTAVSNALGVPTPVSSSTAPSPASAPPSAMTGISVGASPATNAATAGLASGTTGAASNVPSQSIHRDPSSSLQSSRDNGALTRPPVERRSRSRSLTHGSGTHCTSDVSRRQLPASRYIERDDRDFRPMARGPLPVRSRPSPPYRRRSPSPYHRRSPSPYRRRSPSPPYRRRSPSPPYRRRSPSPPYRRRSPTPPYRRRSPSPPYRRRSPSPSYRRRSPSPLYRRRSSTPPRYRGYSPPRRAPQRSHTPTPPYGSEQIQHSRPGPVPAVAPTEASTATAGQRGDQRAPEATKAALTTDISSTNSPDAVPVLGKPLALDRPVAPAKAPIAVPVFDKPFALDRPVAPTKAPSAVPVFDKPFALDRPVAPTKAPSAVPVFDKPFALDRPVAPTKAPIAVPVFGKPFALNGPVTANSSHGGNEAHGVSLVQHPTTEESRNGTGLAVDSVAEDLASIMAVIEPNKGRAAAQTQSAVMDRSNSREGILIQTQANGRLTAVDLRRPSVLSKYLKPELSPAQILAASRDVDLAQSLIDAVAGEHVPASVLAEFPCLFIGNIPPTVTRDHLLTFLLTRGAPQPLVVSYLPLSSTKLANAKKVAKGATLGPTNWAAFAWFSSAAERQAASQKHDGKCTASHTQIRCLCRTFDDVRTTPVPRLVLWTDVMKSSLSRLRKQALHAVLHLKNGIKSQTGSANIPPHQPPRQQTPPALPAPPIAPLPVAGPSDLTARLPTLPKEDHVSIIDRIQTEEAPFTAAQSATLAERLQSGSPPALAARLGDTNGDGARHPPLKRAREERSPPHVASDLLGRMNVALVDRVDTSKRPRFDSAIESDI